jgi:molybdate transport system substrate-binding protein
VGIGVAVRQGAPLPPMADVEDFKRAVLGARKLAYIDPQAGGSSGIYLQGLFQRLGLADAVAAKAVLVPGGLTAMRIVSGEADLAVQQASELAIVDGVVLVGMLPEEIQNFTTYGWALARGSRVGDAAEVFVAALSRVAATGVLKEIGIEPPRAR